MSVDFGTPVPIELMPSSALLDGHVIHPAAAVFPIISEDELASLADDIATNGLRFPIVLDSVGQILDGRNRLIACKLRNIEPRFTTYAGDDAVAFVVSVNLNRRHLTPGQRAFVALELMPIFESQARERMLAGKARADIPEGRARDHAAALVHVSGRNVGHAKRLVSEAPDLAQAVKDGAMTIGDAAGVLIGRNRKSAYLHRQADYDSQANQNGKPWEMRHGDFREILEDLPSESVDAIITDPPYPREFLPLWSELASFAKRVLRPGAPLIAYSGQYFLREVLTSMSEHLEYGWTICLDMPGNNSRFRDKCMIQTWKAILVYTNGKWGPHEWAIDRVESPTASKELYEWQQSYSPMVTMLERYVSPGGLVVDPFAGVGSFGLAALATGHRFIGAELDMERYTISCGRLAEASESDSDR